jgi:hypothetical protein
VVYCAVCMHHCSGALKVYYEDRESGFGVLYRSV